MTTRILVMNCNTSAAMTESIRLAAVSAARPGTQILAAQPFSGPESIEGPYESFLSAAAVLERLATWDDGPFDALVLAGFGEHGREGARQLLDVPVVDITEASANLAGLLGHRFGVVTTVPEAVGQIELSLLTAGMHQRCSSVRAAELRVLDLDLDAVNTAERLKVVARQCLDDGADVIVLGCAGMSSYRQGLSDALGVPVVDGVQAAVTLCEALVDLSLTTSKAGMFRSPRRAAAPA
jgi:allantoin racemase